MTQPFYAPPSPSLPRIPTREEFHWEFAGVIHPEDFSTCRPSRRRIPYTVREASFLHSSRPAASQNDPLS